MGEGNRVASVTLFTFTSEPCPHAHFYIEALPPCSHSLCEAPTPLLTHSSTDQLPAKCWPMIRQDLGS